MFKSNQRCGHDTAFTQHTQAKQVDGYTKGACIQQERTCHTISPFFTRWQDSMYESAYHRDPEEVLPYLQTKTSQVTSYQHPRKPLNSASLTDRQSSGLQSGQNEPGIPNTNAKGDGMRKTLPGGTGRAETGVLPVEGVEGWLHLPVAQAQLTAQTLNDPSATCTSRQANKYTLQCVYSYQQ